jgi:MFS family permease
MDAFQTKPIKAWSITLIGALFFFYAFLQVNMMTPLSNPLMKHFGATPKEIGILSAWFFWANIMFIIPAGLLLDRFPIRLLMIINMILAILGTAIFAFSETISMASVGRFLTGIMMSFGLIIVLKLASLWIPSQKMALASSLIITIGTFGGMVSQTPIAALIQAFGWQFTLIMVALFGILITLILSIFIKEPKKHEGEIKQGQKLSIWKSLFLVFRLPQNWICGFFICLVNLPLAILGAFFGATYLIQIYNFSIVQASSIVSMLFLGMIIGSPFFGWLSDFMKVRKLPMLIGSILCLIFMLMVLFAFHNIMILHFLFFAVGFTSASQVLGYPVITESNHYEISGSALSLAAFIIMGVGYGLSIPFVGFLLNYMWEGKIIEGIQTYSIEAYRHAFLTIPIGILIAIFLLFFMKETRCQSIVKNFNEKKK